MVITFFTCGRFTVTFDRYLIACSYRRCNTLIAHCVPIVTEQNEKVFDEDTIKLYSPWSNHTPKFTVKQLFCPQRFEDVGKSAFSSKTAPSHDVISRCNIFMECLSDETQCCLVKPRYKQYHSRNI